MSGWWSRFASVLQMVKISHSLFALPFALGALLIASRGVPSGWNALWVVLAMVAARSAAMAFNRLVDRDIDAANPRTAGRALPSGALRPGFVLGFVVASSALFMLAASMLNLLCLLLSPLVLGVLLGYSYAKRFTSLSHLWLGLALGLSPVASWLAVRGQFDESLVTPALLGIAVLFWVAGFDLIYACQDEEFDRRSRLHSIPARYGARVALRLAVSFHVITLIALLAMVPLADFGGQWSIAVAVVAGLLVAEHVLARPDRPGSLHVAFFHVNSWVGPVVLAGIFGELWW